MSGGSTSWLAQAEDLLRYAILAVVMVATPFFGAAMAYFVLFAAITLALSFAITQPVALRPDLAGALLLASFLLFAVVTAVVAVVNQRPGELLFVFNFVALPLFVPLLVLLSRDAAPSNTLLIAILALAGALVLLGLALVETNFAGRFRARTSVLDPIRFGSTAVILGFLALMGVRRTSHPARWLFLIAPVAGTIALLLTGSRGPLLALPPLSIVAVFFLAPSRRIALLSIAAIIGASAGIVALSGALGLARVETLIEIPSQLLGGGQVTDESMSNRLEIYSAALAAIQDSPWIGHGWSQLTSAPQPYVASDLLLSNFSHLHNDVLDLLVAIGLPGVVCYVLIICAPVAGAIRSVRDSQWSARVYGCLVLSLTYLVEGQSSLMLGFEYQTVLYVALAAIILGYCRDAPQASRPAPAAPAMRMAA